MDIKIEELKKFIEKDSPILSMNIKMLQEKAAHIIQWGNNIYLRVFFSRDWKDYPLSDYIEFQREMKLNRILYGRK